MRMAKVADNADTRFNLYAPVEEAQAEASADLAHQVVVQVKVHQEEAHLEDSGDEETQW